MITLAEYKQLVARLDAVVNDALKAVSEKSHSSDAHFVSDSKTIFKTLEDIFKAITGSAPARGSVSSFLTFAYSAHTAVSKLWEMRNQFKPPVPQQVLDKISKIAEKCETLRTKLATPQPEIFAQTEIIKTPRVEGGDLNYQEISISPPANGNSNGKHEVGSDNPLSSFAEEQTTSWQTLLDDLQNISKAETTVTNSKASQTLGTDSGIYSALENRLGDCAFIIDPALGSVSSVFDSDPIKKIGAVYNYGKILAGFENEDAKIKQLGFIPEPGEIPKPIVMVLNTVSGTEANNGNHWVVTVILPKEYTTPLGVKIGNKKVQVITIDSLGVQDIPFFLKDSLCNGFTQNADPSLTQTLHKTPPVLIADETEFVCNGKISPQESSTIVSKSLGEPRRQQVAASLIYQVDCGWWAVYNAMMIVLTGKTDYLCTYTDRQPALRLRTLFPEVGQDLVSSHKLKENGNRHSKVPVSRPKKKLPPSTQQEAEYGELPDFEAVPEIPTKKTAPVVYGKVPIASANAPTPIYGNLYKGHAPSTATSNPTSPLILEFAIHPDQHLVLSFREENPLLQQELESLQAQCQQLKDDCTKISKAGKRIQNQDEVNTALWKFGATEIILKNIIDRRYQLKDLRQSRQYLKINALCPSFTEKVGPSQKQRKQLKKIKEKRAFVKRCQRIINSLLNNSKAVLGLFEEWKQFQSRVPNSAINNSIFMLPLMEWLAQAQEIQLVLRPIRPTVDEKHQEIIDQLNDAVNEIEGIVSTAFSKADQEAVHKQIAKDEETLASFEDQLKTLDTDDSGDLNLAFIQREQNAQDRLSTIQSLVYQIYNFGRLLTTYYGQSSQVKRLKPLDQMALEKVKLFDRNREILQAAEQLQAKTKTAISQIQQAALNDDAALKTASTFLTTFSSDDTQEAIDEIVTKISNIKSFADLEKLIKKISEFLPTLKHVQTQLNLCVKLHEYYLLHQSALQKKHPAHAFVKKIKTLPSLVKTLDVISKVAGTLQRMVDCFSEINQHSEKSEADRLAARALSFFKQDATILRIPKDKPISTQEATNLLTHTLAFKESLQTLNETTENLAQQKAVALQALENERQRNLPFTKASETVSSALLSIDRLDKITAVITQPETIEQSLVKTNLQQALAGLSQNVNYSLPTVSDHTSSAQNDDDQNDNDSSDEENSSQLGIDGSENRDENDSSIDPEQENTTFNLAEDALDEPDTEGAKEWLTLKTEQIRLANLVAGNKQNRDHSHKIIIGVAAGAGATIFALFTGLTAGMGAPGAALFGAVTFVGLLGLGYLIRFGVHYKRKKDALPKESSYSEMVKEIVANYSDHTEINVMGAETNTTKHKVARAVLSILLTSNPCPAVVYQVLSSFQQTDEKNTTQDMLETVATQLFKDAQSLVGNESIDLLYSGYADLLYICLLYLKDCLFKSSKAKVEKIIQAILNSIDSAYRVGIYSALEKKHPEMAEQMLAYWTDLPLTGFSPEKLIKKFITTYEKNGVAEGDAEVAGYIDNLLAEVTLHPDSENEHENSENSESESSAIEPLNYKAQVEKAVAALDYLMGCYAIDSLKRQSDKPKFKSISVEKVALGFLKKLFTVSATARDQHPNLVNKFLLPLFDGITSDTFARLLVVLSSTTKQNTLAHQIGPQASPIITSFLLTKLASGKHPTALTTLFQANPAAFVATMTDFLRQYSSLEHRVVNTEETEEIELEEPENSEDLQPTVPNRSAPTSASYNLIFKLIYLQLQQEQPDMAVIRGLICAYEEFYLRSSSFEEQNHPINLYLNLHTEIVEETQSYNTLPPLHRAFGSSCFGIFLCEENFGHETLGDGKAALAKIWPDNLANNEYEQRIAFIFSFNTRATQHNLNKDLAFIRLMRVVSSQNDLQLLQRSVYILIAYLNQRTRVRELENSAKNMIISWLNRFVSKFYVNDKNPFSVNAEKTFLTTIILMWKKVSENTFFDILLAMHKESALLLLDKIHANFLTDEPIDSAEFLKVLWSSTEPGAQKLRTLYLIYLHDKISKIATSQTDFNSKFSQTLDAIGEKLSRIPRVQDEEDEEIDNFNLPAADIFIEELLAFVAENIQLNSRFKKSPQFHACRRLITAMIERYCATILPALSSKPHLAGLSFYQQQLAKYDKNTEINLELKAILSSAYNDTKSGMLLNISDPKPDYVKIGNFLELEYEKYLKAEKQNIEESEKQPTEESEDKKDSVENTSTKDTDEIAIIVDDAPNSKPQDAKLNAAFITMIEELFEEVTKLAPLQVATENKPLILDETSSLLGSTRSKQPEGSAAADLAHRLLMAAVPSRSTAEYTRGEISGGRRTAIIAAVITAYKNKGEILPLLTRVFHELNKDLSNHCVTYFCKTTVTTLMQTLFANKEENRALNREASQLLGKYLFALSNNYKDQVDFTSLMQPVLNSLIETDDPNCGKNIQLIIIESITAILTTDPIKHQKNSKEDAIKYMLFLYDETTNNNSQSAENIRALENHFSQHDSLKPADKKTFLNASKTFLKQNANVNGHYTKKYPEPVVPNKNSASQSPSSFWKRVSELRHKHLKNDSSEDELLLKNNSGSSTPKSTH